MKRIHLVISGKVQGVFYRDFVRKAAEKLNIKGFVKNLDDGTVEVVAEGEDSKLKELIKECNRGSFLAFVEKIDVKEEKATGDFEEFQIEF